MNDLKDLLELALTDGYGPDPGQWVVVQAPASLGWNSAELARFASGVQVLVTAQQGRG